MKRKKPAPGRAAAAFPVVGIGASAGGLQAMARLLGRIPANTGMSFVVVQHLAPDHESLLSGILQKGARIPIEEARHGAKIAADHVYIIPPNKLLAIEGGRLRLSPRPPHALAVDHFLRSLAEERRLKAVAVILSGTSHDGAAGARAVKAAGGLVFAQDPKTAEHPGMPEAAIATGAVDLTLSPEDIAAELERVAHHPLVSAPTAAAPPPDGEQALARIFKLLRAATGLDFSHYKPTTVWRRMSRRLILHRLEGLEAYARLLEKSPDEVRALHGDLLIHVTQFFRELPAFEALRSKVFPKLLKANRGDATLRVWVPGCSTGEEVYSLAIFLLDYLAEKGGVNPVQIFATDVSETAVDRARLGVYPPSIAEDVPAHLLRRYFVKAEGGYQVAKRVRESCVFARHNLAQDPPFANMDLISCRNVLIYMAPTLQRRVVPVLHYALKPGGALLLGSSESIGEFASLFAPLDKRHRLYQKRPVPPRLRLDLFARPSGAGEGPARAPLLARTVPHAWPEADVQRVADRLLLSRYAPAGVVINADLEILQFRGRVSRFLEPASGRASLSLLKMLPDACHPALRELLRRAGKRDGAARQAPLLLTAGGVRRRVTVEVLPFEAPLSGERYFLVLFADQPAAKDARGAAGPAPKGGEKGLMRELAAAQAGLESALQEQQATNEELKTANEEIISANEELQSTNEELETAKEELQAANEELTTVNEELQNRNQELAQASGDMANLLASAQMPILMVGSDLRIRRFTPLAEKFMNLIPSDVGRPLGDIKLKLDVPDLEDRVLDVIETVHARDSELQDDEGRWYSLRIRPYKTAENKIEGAVLLLVDIDETKRGLLELKENAAFAAAVRDMTRQPMLLLDGELRVKTASRSFYETFGLTPAVVGRPVLEAAGWAGSRELGAALERVVQSGEPFADLRVRTGGRLLGFSARRILVEGRAVSFVLTVDLLQPGN